MLLLDELPTEVSEQQAEEPKYCHLVCIYCADHITLCGAYKPVLCQGKMNLILAPAECEVCKRMVCPDCETMAFQACRRCGS
jgi:hypothetical protein